MTNELLEKTIKKMANSPNFENEMISFMTEMSFKRLKRLFILTMRDKSVRYKKQPGISKNQIKQKILCCRNNLEFEGLLKYQWFQELAHFVLDNANKITECDEL